METLIIIGIILITIISIILVWINMPGSFLLLLTTFLMGWYTDFTFITKKMLLITLFIYILLEILEFLLGAIVVKLYGGKSSSAFLSILGGFIGGFIGSFIIPIIGTFIGLIIGSYLMTYYNEKKLGKSQSDAIKIANSSTLGYILSKGLKTIAILVFVVLLIIQQ